MNDPVIITLSQPVQAHGQTLTALTFRPPTGRDLRQCGYPLDFTDNGDSWRINAAVVSRLMSTLAGIPTSSVDALCIADWTAGMTAVTGFLGDTVPRSSTATSTSPDSGATSTPSSP